MVMTVGHSTHAIDEFLALLRGHGVQRLVDVRTVPRSRHNPQFNRDEFSEWLRAAGLGYTYLPGLGGFRRARHGAAEQAVDNSGWRSASFRAYADYMQTPEFEQNLEQLIALAQAEKIAIMCAEAVPWRCHRSLIADALTVRGIEVREIIGATSERVHTLTPFAQVNGTRISYPSQQTTES
jgi:uncharacterized protein (DUF488 family)